MTSKIQIVSTTIDHIWELLANLREADKKEIFALGITPDKALFDSYRKSILRKTILVDEEVAGVWGVYGSALGLVGQPYFLTGPSIEKINPMKFSRLYKQEVQEMQKIFPILENYVDATYLGAIRMLKIAGFRLSDPINVNGNYFRRFEATV